MKKILYLVSVVLLLTVSCGEGIKKRPETHRRASSARIEQAGVNSDEPPTLKSIRERVVDSLDVRQRKSSKRHETKPQGPMLGAASRHLEISRSRGRDYAAYQLGKAFANFGNKISDDDKRLMVSVLPSDFDADSLINSLSDTSEVFFDKYINYVENSGNSGLAALMVSGYYFGQLVNIAESANDETGLPDEKFLNDEIAKIESLKIYLNESLKAEKEVKTAMILQRAERMSDSVKNTYQSCTMNYSGNGYKYNNLIASIKAIDNIFD